MRPAKMIVAEHARLCGPSARRRSPTAAAVWGLHRSGPGRRRRGYAAAANAKVAFGRITPAPKFILTLKENSHDTANQLDERCWESTGGGADSQVADSGAG